MDWLISNRNVGDDSERLEEVTATALEGMTSSKEGLAVLFCKTFSMNNFEEFSIRSKSHEIIRNFKIPGTKFLQGFSVAKVKRMKMFIHYSLRSKLAGFFYDTVHIWFH